MHLKSDYAAKAIPLAELLWHASMCTIIRSPRAEASRYLQSRHILPHAAALLTSTRRAKTDRPGTSSPRGKQQQVIYTRPDTSLYHLFDASLAKTNIVRMFARVRHAPGALDIILFQPLQELDSSAPAFKRSY